MAQFTSNQIHINIFRSSIDTFRWCIHKSAENAVLNRLLPWLLVISTDFLLIPKLMHYSHEGKRNTAW